MIHTCSNCGGQKPDGYYKACVSCRKKWRDAKGRVSKQLIEAAPDLLAALERCYEVFRMHEADTAISLQVGMALTKARGLR